MTTVHWITFSTDRGGIVQANVTESVGRGASKRELAHGDVTKPLSEFSEATQNVLLDALASVADELGHSPSPIKEIDE